ncbi:MAG: PD-(D/E)XK nuclease family protein [Erysipelotrichales bacterium]|nr:PD-(D/E)XK nuclease family protein [Erysipelotrichales bacterium]
MKEIKFETPSDFDKTRSISISAVIDMISPQFDREAVVQKTFDKNFNNPESKYYQMSKEQILEMWEEKGATSRYYGSSLDDYIGLRFTGHPNDVEIFKMDKVEGDNRMEGLCESFDKFYKEHVDNGPLEYVNREQYIYYPIDIDGEQWYVRGRFDCLFYNTETNHYIIVDWKSNGEIETSPTKWTEKLYGPAKSLYNLSGVKYTTQVFFYKLGLENQLNNEEVVDVAITNLPGYDNENNPQVKIYGAQYKYDKDLIENILKYAIKKKKLLDSKKEE